MGGGKIQHLNLIKGDFSIFINKACIGNQNKISSSCKAYHDVTLELHEYSHVTAGHLLDMTDSIDIGKRTTLAGAGTQIWTHSFLRSKELGKNVRIDAPVRIGEWCYIGARCNIMLGVSIANEVTVGAQTVIAKSLEKSGTYVGQGLRYIDTNYKNRIMNLGAPVHNNNIYRK